MNYIRNEVITFHFKLLLYNSELNYSNGSHGSEKIRGFRKLLKI